jgi:hypothetical protein
LLEEQDAVGGMALERPVAVSMLVVEIAALAVEGLTLSDEVVEREEQDRVLVSSEKVAVVV